MEAGKVMIDSPDPEAAGADLILRARDGDAIEDLQSLDLERYAHEPLLNRVWALRHNLTAYDAVYVALAELLDTTLLTYDSRLAQAPGLSKRVELIQ